MKLSIKETRQLLSKCFYGDRKASEAFVGLFSNLVYRTVQNTLLTKQVSFNSQDLEDLHNTVFLQFFDRSCKKLRQYRGINGCSLASWIRVVTVRFVLNHIRKKGIDAMTWQQKRISLDDLPELKSGEAEYWVQRENAEQERILQRGIRKLQPRDRMFMKLHSGMGLPMEEIAAILQISLQNAYTIKHRAIQRLKNIIFNSN